MHAEEWRPVVGFNGYEVSNLGRVRSYWQKGTGKLFDEPQCILSSKNNGRYPRVVLSKGGARYGRAVHGLVASAFLGQRPEGLVVCHNNDDGHHNHLSNLRYDTQQSNIRQASPRIGRKGKFSKSEVIEIRNRYFAGETATALAAEFDCSRNNISHICSGRTYKLYGGPTGNKGTKISESDVREIRQLRRGDGFSLDQIATRFGIDRSYVSLIVNFKRRQGIGNPQS